ncbi:MAG: hypothetical protein COA68_12370 [Oceanobacter sp.]|nr:MAG: hypothetical protein COA68_12370 [Oceanobacter sp.]
MECPFFARVEPEDFWYPSENEDTTRGYQEPHQRQNGKVELKIEPIVNGGGIKTKAIWNDFKTTRFLQETKNLLEGEHLNSIPMEPNPTISRAIDERIGSQLEAYNVARKTNQGRIKRYMNIFLRRKTENLARIIGHPATLNEAYKPPSMTLCSLSTMMAALTAMTTENQKIYFYEADFKNYFPQIPVGWKVEEQMGFTMKRNKRPRAEGKSESHLIHMTQRVLTQGWNCSTFCAQSITWASILYSGDNTWLGETVGTGNTSPPAFIQIEHPMGKGIIIVIYDNILVAMNNETLQEKWIRRLQSNFKRYNIALKYAHETVNNCRFCGIETKIENNEVQWRTNEEVFLQWKTKTIAHGTAKEAYSIGGVIARQLYVQRASNGKYRDLFKILREINSEMAESQHERWRERNYVNTERKSEILDALAQIDNEWTTQKRKPNIVNPLFLVSDATTTKLCWILMDQKGTILGKPVSEKVEGNGTEKQSIDVCEALAIERALATNDYRTRVTHHDGLVCVVDNTPVGRSLVKGYSMSEPLNKVIEMILGNMTPLTLLAAVDIPTDENLADIGTRGGDWESEEAQVRSKMTATRIARSMEPIQNGVRWIGREMIKVKKTDGEGAERLRM